MQIELLRRFEDSEKV